MKINWVLWSLFSVIGPNLFAQDTVRSFDVGANPRLVLENMAGDIIIKRGKSGQVRVTAANVDGKVDVEMTQKGDRIRVKTRSGQGHNRSNHGIRFHIEFPERGELEINSLAGDLSVDGVSGYLRLRSVSGDIEVAHLSGRLVLHTVSGDVAITQTGVCEVDAVSMSGDISYSRGSLEGGDYSFSSTSGNVLIAFPIEASFSLIGRTISGTIKDRSNHFEVTKAKYSNISSLAGKVGDGDAKVRANSVSGDIKIWKE